jgi:excisionase family DNA binding protein
MPQNATTSTGPLLLSIEKAAEALSLSKWMVYRLADSGDLESVYQGRRRYIVAASLAAYVEGLPTTPGDVA